MQVAVQVQLRERDAEQPAIVRAAEIRGPCGVGRQERDVDRRRARNQGPGYPARAHGPARHGKIGDLQPIDHHRQALRRQPRLHRMRPQFQNHRIGGRHGGRRQAELASAAHRPGLGILGRRPAVGGQFAAIALRAEIDVEGQHPSLRSLARPSILGAAAAHQPHRQLGPRPRGTLREHARSPTRRYSPSGCCATPMSLHRAKPSPLKAVAPKSFGSLTRPARRLPAPLTCCATVASSLPQAQSRRGGAPCGASCRRIG